jgi:hypothetical protein
VTSSGHCLGSLEFQAEQQAVCSVVTDVHPKTLLLLSDAYSNTLRHTSEDLDEGLQNEI